MTCATPLLSGETGRVGSSDLPDGLSGIFLREGMDNTFGDCPSGYFVAAVVSEFDLRAKRSSSQRATKGFVGWASEEAAYAQLEA